MKVQIDLYNGTRYLSFNGKSLGWIEHTSNGYEARRYGSDVAYVFDSLIEAVSFLVGPTKPMGKKQ